MKKPISKCHLYGFVFKMVLSIAVLWCQNAKSSPFFLQERQIAFNRAKTLDNGISISWLEHTWNKNTLQTAGVKDTDLKLLKTLGFKTIRLPVAFRYFEENHVPLQQVLLQVDRVWKLCRQYGFKLISD